MRLVTVVVLSMLLTGCSETFEDTVKACASACYKQGTLMSNYRANYVGGDCTCHKERECYLSKIPTTSYVEEGCIVNDLADKTPEYDWKVNEDFALYLEVLTPYGDSYRYYPHSNHVFDGTLAAVSSDVTFLRRLAGSSPDPRPLIKLRAGSISYHPRPT